MKPFISFAENRGDGMAKSMHPQYLTLRVLASKLELGLLTKEEVQLIASIFRRIAEGESAEDLFGGRPLGRPKKYQTLYYVDQVFGLTQPSFNGTPGLKVAEAITRVATANHVSPDSVKTAYYSKLGRSVRESMLKALMNS